MAQWTFYRLDPKSGAGFHFGLRGLEGETSSEHCPSDTLFAALVSTLADLDGDGAVRAFTAPFEAHSPPYLLTSLFPRAGDLPLLPRPFVRIEMETQPGQRKFLKRLCYVSPGIFRALLRGERMDDLGPDSANDQGRFLQGDRVWLRADEQDALPDSWSALDRKELREHKVWQSDPVDRVTIDRASSASAIYRVGRTTYAPGCGLWLGAQWPAGVDAAAAAQLETLLHHLGDRGLGGERSVGYGQFSINDDKAPSLDLPTTSGPYALSLSRYLPAEKELPGVLREDAAYGLVNVAGWMGSPQGAAYRRKGIRLLAEGSVLHTRGDLGPWGRLVDVKPDIWKKHPVWRYGYACLVGVHPGAVEVQNA